MNKYRVTFNNGVDGIFRAVTMDQAKAIAFGMARDMGTELLDQKPKDKKERGE